REVDARDRGVGREPAWDVGIHDAGEREHPDGLGAVAAAGNIRERLAESGVLRIDASQPHADHRGRRGPRRGVGGRVLEHKAAGALVLVNDVTRTTPWSLAVPSEGETERIT